MNTLLVEAPLNSLSFGNVSVNILRELWKKNINVGLFTLGNVDLSAFKIEQPFLNWLQKSIECRWDVLSQKAPSLKLWHFNDGENRKSNTQNLLTFYECSHPTKTEIAIAKSQNKVLVSSNYAVEKFSAYGCDNFSFVPIGFDENFFLTGREYLKSDIIHFGLMGKYEKRKNTANIIKAWLKKYGNNNNYQLTCCITNPFFSQDQMSSLIKDLFDGKRYTNINFLPFLKTNEEVNELLNAIDIDLTGLSFAEGWNLPSFNATCLGKWSIVTNNTSHKDWANKDNSILVECDGQVSCEDGFFFHKGGDFNQGFFPTYSEDAMMDAFDRAEKVIAANKVNVNGISLGKSLTYSNTVDKILKSFN